MKNLASPKVVKEILNERGFKFSKSLGQNFLIDENALSKIIDASEIDENTNVIEIGPGFGSLTQRLCERAKKVLAIEIDSLACDILHDVLQYDNLKIINNDVLKIDLNKLIEQEFDGGDIKLIANLPYYITTPIIMGLLENKIKISSIVVMIQKEVADRINASCGTKDYGALTLAVNYYSTPNVVFTIGPGSFMPPPKVSSSVIKLDIREDKPVEVFDENALFKVIKAAFAQRRKTLLNALCNSNITCLSKEEIKQKLDDIGIDQNRRGETLTLCDFANLTNAIFE